MEAVVETEETGEEGARKFVESSDATLESIQSTPEESRHITTWSLLKEIH